jgi:hypothetical protein
MSIKSYNSKVDQIFINTSLTQQMTVQDWQHLNELAESSLAKDDERMVRRIMHSVRRGWIQVLNA